MVYGELWLIFFIGCVVVGAFTGKLAEAKGYEPISWFVGGFFFNLVALITMVGMPIKQSVAPPKN